MWVMLRVGVLVEARRGSAAALAVAVEFDGAGLRATARAIALRGALTPMNLEAVCLVIAMEVAGEGDKMGANSGNIRV